MAKKSGLERRGLSAPLILFCILMLGLTIFSFFELRASITRAQASLLTAASDRIALRISEKLDALLDIGQQIKSFALRESDMNYESMQSVADAALNRYPYISAITIAPGAIVRYSFPEEGASASVGHDLLDNPERMQALVQSVSKKQAVLQGPDISAEGVALAFLRIPVFNARDLWGFISISFNVDALMNSLNLKAEFPGVRIAFATIGTKEHNIDVFWGEERARQGYSSLVMLGPDKTEWTVIAAPMYPAEIGLWWGGTLAIVAIFGIVGLFFFFGRLDARPNVRRESRNTTAQDHFDVAPFNVHMPFEKEIEPVTEPAEVSQASMEVSPAPSIQPIASEETKPQNVSKSDTSENHTPVVDAPVTVLVVDDSEVNRELLVRMLTLKGYRAESLQSGKLALAMLETRNFDLMLIDCIMPEMDGYALAHAIRMENDGVRSSKSKAPLLIAMSPHHDVDEADKCARAGFDGLLIKPFTMTSLDQKIKELLAKRFC